MAKSRFSRLQFGLVEVVANRVAASHRAQENQATTKICSRNRESQRTSHRALNIANASNAHVARFQPHEVYTAGVREDAKCHRKDGPEG